MEVRIMVNKKRVSIFKKLRREYKRLVKPDKKTLCRMTLKTLVWSFIIAISVFIVDTGFMYLISLFI